MSPPRLSPWPDVPLACEKSNVTLPRVVVALVVILASFEAKFTVPPVNEEAAFSKSSPLLPVLRRVPPDIVTELIVSATVEKSRLPLVIVMEEVSAIWLAEVTSTLPPLMVILPTTVWLFAAALFSVSVPALMVVVPL